MYLSVIAKIFQNNKYSFIKVLISNHVSKERPVQIRTHKLMKFRKLLPLNYAYMIIYSCNNIPAVGKILNI